MLYEYELLSMKNSFPNDVESAYLVSEFLVSEYLVVSFVYVSGYNHVGLTRSVLLQPENA
jgi:hypothetical protein